MKMNSLKLIALFGMIAASATTVFADNGKPNGGDGNGKNNRGRNRIAVNRTIQGQGFEPIQSSYVVQAGDSLQVISLKEYGTSSNGNFIARFNHLQPTQALVLGQTLSLPSIGPNGQLTLSRAPAA